MKKTIIISGFPGTWKSYLFENSDKIVLDSDSSKFNKSEFPENYIKHIKENIGKVDIILVSSHLEVRNALVDNCLFFTVVYPDLNIRDEYVQRFAEKGSSEGFINLISHNWDSWISQLRDQKKGDHIILYSGEFISDLTIV